jgi:hypothetical protein
VRVNHTIDSNPLYSQWLASNFCEENRFEKAQEMIPINNYSLDDDLK